MGHCIWFPVSGLTTAPPLLMPSGHLPACKLLREQLGCPWDESVVHAAVKGGHTEVVRWLLDSRDCPPIDER